MKDIIAEKFLDLKSAWNYIQDAWRVPAKISKEMYSKAHTSHNGEYHR